MPLDDKPPAYGNQLGDRLAELRSKHRKALSISVCRQSRGASCRHAQCNAFQGRRCRYGTGVLPAAPYAQIRAKPGVALRLVCPREASRSVGSRSAAGRGRGRLQCRCWPKSDHSHERSRRGRVIDRSASQVLPARLRLQAGFGQLSGFDGDRHIVGRDFTVLARDLVLSVVGSRITGVSRIEDHLGRRLQGGASGISCRS